MRGELGCCHLSVGVIDSSSFLELSTKHLPSQDELRFAWVPGESPVDGMPRFVSLLKKIKKDNASYTKHYEKGTNLRSFNSYLLRTFPLNIKSAFKEHL